MSFGLSADEQQIAQNLGSLEGYLGQRQYATALVPMNADNTVGRYDPQTMAYAQGGQTPYAVQGVGAAPGYLPYQTQPQVQPGIDPDQFAALQEYALRLEQSNLAAAQQAIQAEEYAFRAAIADLPEEDQVIAWQQRQIDQLAQANGALSQRLQITEEMAEEEEQEYYKDVVASELCRRAGINYANPQVEAAFMAAQTMPEMHNLVNLLTANRPRPVQQALPQQAMQQRPPGWAAAAGTAVPAGAQAVRPGSGDLAGYLRAKGGYQVAYVE